MYQSPTDGFEPAAHGHLSVGIDGLFGAVGSTVVDQVARPALLDLGVGGNVLDVAGVELALSLGVGPGSPR